MSAKSLRLAESLAVVSSASRCMTTLGRESRGTTAWCTAGRQQTTSSSRGYGLPQPGPGRRPPAGPQHPPPGVDPPKGEASPGPLSGAAVAAGCRPPSRRGSTVAQIGGYSCWAPTGADHRARSKPGYSHSATGSARSSARRSAGHPLVVEDGHQHLVVPARVVQHRLAIAALLDEPRLLVGADPGGVERATPS